MDRCKLNLIQINLGNKCNQICTHCHVDASPDGDKNMTLETAENILKKLIAMDINDIEFTGGAPELNPNLNYFISELSRNNKKITVRTNLTILDSSKYSHFIETYKQHNVKLISSLPSLLKDTVDSQRGKNVFSRSISVLQKLNEAGYAKGDLTLDIIYNPAGSYLPPDQSKLGKEYKSNLKEKYNIEFNNLLTIVNSPVSRFKAKLENENKYDEYLKLLKENHNENTKERVMCKTLLSVGYDGSIYDCDFNLACNKKIPGYEDMKFWDIDFDKFNPEILFYDHCYACMVNSGSSCHGALIKENNKTTDPDVKKNSKSCCEKEIQYSTEIKKSNCCTNDNNPV